jgi:hypothetical protein
VTARDGEVGLGGNGARLEAASVSRDGPQLVE